MFADDLILFYKAHPASLQYVMKALEEFHACARLQANPTKSQVVFGGYSQEQQQQCVRIIGLPERSFLLKYLGAPITTSRLTKIECRGLVDKILAKVHLWATRSISFARRAKLITSVIFGMFNYWASIFMLPNEVLDNITKIYRSYL